VTDGFEDWDRTGWISAIGCMNYNGLVICD
jgi:hypothetical protein